MYLESSEMPILERILRRPAFTACNAGKLQNLSLAIFRYNNSNDDNNNCWTFRLNCGPPPLVILL